MPLAQGIMIINRLNVYNTTTALNIVESGPYTCGETIHFHVVVTNVSSGTPTPTGGTVNIFDSNSSTVIASGTLSSGSVTISYTLPTGNFSLVAQYLGTSSNPIFTASNSPTPTLLSAVLNFTTTTITSPPAHLDFCANDNLSFNATVSSGIGSPTGSVQFNYSTNGGATFNLFATSTLSGGATSATLNGGTLTGSTLGNKVFFQAVYVGAGCFAASSSSAQDGYAISSQVTTTVVLSPSSGTTIGAGDPVTIEVQVSDSSIGGVLINEGSVALFFAFSSTNTPPSNYPSGDWSMVPTGINGANNNPITPSNDLVNFVFQSGGNFFQSAGTYYFVAVYTGTPCFNNSTTDTNGASAFNIVLIGT